MVDELQCIAGLVVHGFVVQPGGGHFVEEFRPAGIRHGVNPQGFGVAGVSTMPRALICS